MKPSLLPTPAFLRRTARATGWSIENHRDTVYDALAWRSGALLGGPDWFPHLRQKLVHWNADLGARQAGGVDWDGLRTRGVDILWRLEGMGPLGTLSHDQLHEIAAVVGEFESFKKTSTRSMVFGSKVAHMHFPWLVPVTSSEVIAGLHDLADAFPEDVAAWLDIRPSNLRGYFAARFTDRLAADRAYRGYLRLANGVMRGVRARECFPEASDRPYTLEAKAAEWWVIAMRDGGPSVTLGTGSLVTVGEDARPAIITRFVDEDQARVRFLDRDDVADVDLQAMDRVVARFDGASSGAPPGLARVTLSDGLSQWVQLVFLNENGSLSTEPTMPLLGTMHDEVVDGACLLEFGEHYGDATLTFPGIDDLVAAKVELHAPRVGDKWHLQRPVVQDEGEEGDEEKDGDPDLEEDDWQDEDDGQDHAEIDDDVELDEWTIIDVRPVVA